MEKKEQKKTVRMKTSEMEFLKRHGFGNLSAGVRKGTEFLHTCELFGVDDVRELYAILNLYKNDITLDND
jgi:hypothetical protein